MIDKDWLERVTIAYSVYQKDVGYSSDVKQFISWLYDQYGIVKPTKIVEDYTDHMCPNCVTPWKCNGPHSLEQ